MYMYVSNYARYLPIKTYYLYVSGLRERERELAVIVLLKSVECKLTHMQEASTHAHTY